MDDGEIYQALRESLALRPPPSELIGLFVRRHMASANDSQDVVGGKDPREFLREAAQRIFLEPWATVQSGHVVEFHQLPEMPFGIARD